MQTEATPRVPDERTSGALGFASFVKDLDKRIGPDGVNVARIRCPPESRLSQEFESRMQALLVNYDLDGRQPSAAASALAAACDDPYEAVGVSVECASGTFDAALNGDSNDGELLPDSEQDEADESGDRSSDDQQHSRSLSLSYSLSISHTMEHSQSTDKGLSKRYDSPCSYEDDRESECTNFDKLDDWNDFINDMQNNNGTANNNNNGECAGKDFKVYYDGYLASKMQTSGGDVNDGPPSATEKCRSYLEYRSSLAPESGWDEELLDDNSNLPLDDTVLDGHGPQTVAKRKRALDDAGEYEDLASELAKFKLLKTDHDNQWQERPPQESPSKTPIPALPDDGSMSSATTTPTNCAKKLPPGEAGRALLMDDHDDAEDDFIPFGAIETLILEP